MRPLFILGVLAVAGCGGPDWQEYVSPEGGFRVLLPPSNLPPKELNNCDYGVWVTDPKGGLTCSVAAWAFASPVKGSLDDELRKFVKSQVQHDELKQISEKDIALGDRKGKEVVYEQPSYKQQIRARFFVTPRRAFMVKAITDADKGERLESAAANKYFDSFRINLPD